MGGPVGSAEGWAKAKVVTVGEGWVGGETGCLARWEGLGWAEVGRERVGRVGVGKGWVGVGGAWGVEARGAQEAGEVRGAVRGSGAGSGVEGRLQGHMGFAERQ